MKSWKIGMLEGRTQLSDEQHRRLLIVDNDRRIVDILKNVFEAEHYSVDVSYCGEAAAEKNSQAKYPCAILDYSLPDMKGDELALSMKRSNPDMGIILLTGFKSAIDPMKLQHFDYVFEKPASADDLIGAVGKLIKLAEIANK